MYEDTYISPGCVAPPPTIFSVMGDATTKSSGNSSRAMASAEASVVAAPPMSARMSFVPCCAKTDMNDKEVKERWMYGRGLEANTSGIERDSLADKSERACVGLLGTLAVTV